VCRLPVAGTGGDADSLRGTLYHSHTVSFRMQHRCGHFQTSNKIRIVANELRMFKNKFNIPNYNSDSGFPPHCAL